MKTVNIFLIVICIWTQLLAQENIKTIFKGDFTIRDFLVENDTIFFIKKRNLFLFDTQNKSLKERFIGGYGLELLSENKRIITVSNELVENVSSIRFFKRLKDKPDCVFYNKDGKVVDFVNIPEYKIFALSLISQKIIFVDYSKKPKFTKIIEIDLDTLSRKIEYKNGSLFFVTDLGGFYEYNINSNTKTKLFQDDELITDFSLEHGMLYFTTIKGKVKRVNLQTKEVKEFRINGFVTTFASCDDSLVCGTWCGDILIVDKKSFGILKKEKVHDRTILKILKYNDTTYYSSGVDQTIKKWNYQIFKGINK